MVDMVVHFISLQYNKTVPAICHSFWFRRLCKYAFFFSIQGLECLHKSAVKSHGNLKSSNCVIDSRWVLKLTDFGAIVNNMEDEPTDMDREHEYYSS